MIDIALSQVSRALQAADVTFGLGGSRLLMHHGLTTSANDLDLLVAALDAERAHQALLTIGSGSAGASKSPFCSIHFYQHLVHRSDVDVIGGYRIRHSQGVYEQVFDSQSVSGYLLLDGGVQVPLSALEDWYVTYQLFPQKKDKADLIEAHFQKWGIVRPELLARALQGVLPDGVRDRITRLLAQLR